MPRLLALAALLLALPATAQSVKSATPLEEGARALIFGVNGIGLQGLDGSSLGIKWHRSEARAVRLGVTVDALAQATFGDDRNGQTAVATVTVIPLRYRRSRTPVYLYSGIGPTGLLRFRREDRSAVGSQMFTTVGAGVAGVVGVEWVVAEAIGVTGEYGQEALLEADFFEDDTVRVSTRSRGVRLGLAVYF